MTSLLKQLWASCTSRDGFRNQLCERDEHLDTAHSGSMAQEEQPSHSDELPNAGPEANRRMLVVGRGLYCQIHISLAVDMLFDTLISAINWLKEHWDKLSLAKKKSVLKLPERFFQEYHMHLPEGLDGILDALQNDVNEKMNDAKHRRVGGGYYEDGRDYTFEVVNHRYLVALHTRPSWHHTAGPELRFFDVQAGRVAAFHWNGAEERLYIQPDGTDYWLPEKTRYDRTRLLRIRPVGQEIDTEEKQKDLWQAQINALINDRNKFQQDCEALAKENHYKEAQINNLTADRDQLKQDLGYLAKEKEQIMKKNEMLTLVIFVVFFGIALAVCKQYQVFSSFLMHRG